MKQHYLGFEYYDSPATTWGNTRNKYTGKHNVAGELVVFYSPVSRLGWVHSGKVTCGMQGNARQVVTKQHARQLRAGLTLPEFNQLIIDLSL